MIGTHGESQSGKSVLSEWLDDDDEGGAEKFTRIQMFKNDFQLKISLEIALFFKLEYFRCMAIMKISLRCVVGSGRLNEILRDT